MIETGHARDEARRVPIYSLYSETREPTAEMLRDLDVLVIDLQDVGTRIYTYIYTMANCLRGGAQARRQGRSSAIGRTRSAASAVEGPMLVPGFESFVGLYPIPMRHGMTIGELARLFNEHFGIGADLEVVADGGLAPRHVLRRDRPAVGRCRRPTSRRSTRRSSIPATVLFEGTNVSEGRGTTRPFELVGAPWVDAERFADGDERASSCRGVRFRPAVFEPTFHKHAGTSCGGCQIHVLDRADVPAGRNRRRADRGVSRRRSGSFPLARSARTSTSTTSCRSTSWPDRRSCASRSTPACRRARSRGRGSRTWPRF